MHLIRMKEMEGKKNKRGVIAKQLLKHDNVQIMNLILEAGDSIPEHSVPVDVFFYIVEGKGTIKIADSEYKVEPQDIVTCAPETKMSVQADQGERFIILNVKTPSL